MCELALTKAQSEKRKVKSESAKRKRVLTPLFECKLPKCAICYIEEHNSHEWSDVNVVADRFRKQMATDVKHTASGVEMCREMLQHLEKEMKDFEEQIGKTEAEINAKAENWKQKIDIQKKQLLTELASMKKKRIKEIESLREEIERQLLSIESYKKYVDEVREKGTACDVARAASDLRDRANELVKFDVIERALSDFGHANVAFNKPSKKFGQPSEPSLGTLRLAITKTGTYIVHCLSTKYLYRACTAVWLLNVKNKIQQLYKVVCVRVKAYSIGQLRLLIIGKFSSKYTTQHTN